MQNLKLNNLSNYNLLLKYLVSKDKAQEILENMKTLFIQTKHQIYVSRENFILEMTVDRQFF